ncbi:hypothetical protein [Lunatibacter salilacus]|uniref:hypothetical protein n=1 Tax=Lunatibacter salilacus TaxID=2483804 RepID=UPI00131CA1D3|nr:hypothetical protein [Lunatibacter salilacus]
MLNQVSSNEVVTVDNQPISAIVDQFNNLPSQPMALPLKRDLAFDESGGHIQGIQLFLQDGEISAFLAGSSKDAAYVAQVNLGKEAQVETIDTLMLSPFRHAGGFQIYDHFLAVGIEDNYARTTSKVMIYDLGVDKNWKKPVYTLERNGPYERSTAGAIGITRYKDEFILVVADWNARNLDFYSCPFVSFEKKTGHFTQIGSLETASMERYSWSDTLWHSYQNINLLADESGLYAIAMGRDLQDNQVADLFTITLEASIGNQIISPVETESLNQLTSLELVNKFSPREISLNKISTKQFQCQGGADFRAGAGVFHSGSGLVLAASPNHMDNLSSINLFAIPADLLISTPIGTLRVND